MTGILEREEMGKMSLYKNGVIVSLQGTGPMSACDHIAVVPRTDALDILSV